MSPQRKYLLLALLALLGTLCVVAHASPTPNTSRSLHSGSVSSRGDYPIDQMNRRATTVAERLEKIEELKKTATRKKFFKSKEEKAEQQTAMHELEREIMLANSAISDDDNSTEATEVRKHYTWLMKMKGFN